MRLVTPEQMRMLEQTADASGISYETMMDHAGRALYAVLFRQVKDLECPHIVFLCGNGNNGGDCFVAAHYLSERGVHVTVALTSGVPKTIRAYAEYKKMQQVTVVNAEKDILDVIQTADIVVDGIYGIGFHGTLRPEIARLLHAAQGRFCVAVDVPSGGDPASGHVAPGTLRCRVTVTFGACKSGMVQYPLKEYCGDVMVANIGLPAEAFDEIPYPSQVMTPQSIRGLLPKRKADSHKGDFGRLLCLTGSECMPGAAIMSAKAALRCGVGLLQVATPRTVMQALCVQSSEPMYLPMQTDADGYIDASNLEALLRASERCSAMLIGCGLGVTDGTKTLVRKLLTSVSCPIILDADGLNCIAGCIDMVQEVQSGVVLTPHPAEMARLLGTETAQVQEDRMACASGMAHRQNAVVVLKGAGTIVAAPDRAFVNPTGNSGMSKGGSGDVLAGMIASFAAQGMALADAARLGVYLHGRAGDVTAARLSQHAMLPTDLIEALPAQLLELEQQES